MKAIRNCLLALVLIAASCSKSSTNSPTNKHNVEYRVLNAQKSIVQLEYNDASGNSVHGDISGQNDTLWSKTISAPDHFHAELKVDFNNTTAVPINYTLVILFDGIVKDSQTGQVPADGISKSTADYESE